jgi:hypothetical protein
VDQPPSLPLHLAAGTLLDQLVRYFRFYCRIIINKIPEDRS